MLGTLGALYILQTVALLRYARSGNNMPNAYPGRLICSRAAYVVELFPLVGQEFQVFDT